MEAPLTPPVPLAALTADRELGLRLLAGPAGADVYGVHASEMADPSPYLLGGELLLTAGAELGPDPDVYVARLVGAGVGAVGFGVTPVHETVWRPSPRPARGTGCRWWRCRRGPRSRRSAGRCGG